MSELRVVLVTVATAVPARADATRESADVDSRGVEPDLDSDLDSEGIRSVDLALNCDVPTSRLIDLLRRTLGRAPDAMESPAEVARWSLHAVDGANRSGQQSLREFGVVDGDVLVLTCAHDPEPAQTAEAVR